MVGEIIELCFTQTSRGGKKTKTFVPEQLKSLVALIMTQKGVSITKPGVGTGQKHILA